MLKRLEAGEHYLQACERGLQVIDAYQLTLGAVEMRAAATAHGTALTEIAVRAALAADDPARPAAVDRTLAGEDVRDSAGPASG